jgi:TRAP-type C4-dicarboxylate transport system substrate-binding protein
MLEELKRRSDGRITYTTFFGGALGKGPEHFDIVARGLSDMGYFTATWLPGRFPLSDVLSMATWVEGKDFAVEIGHAVYERILYREFPDVKVLHLNGCIQAFLWTREPVRTLEEAKGLKIRTPGGLQTHYIEAIGAEPIFMPLGEVYLAMEMGVIDGIVTCPPLFLAFKLYEVAKYATLTTFGCVTEGLIMNKDSWERTPADLRAIIEEIGSNPFAITGGLTSRAYEDVMKELADKGVEFYTLPPVEAERWFATFQEKTRKWVADLEAKGLPAREVVEIFNEEAEKRGVKVVAFPPEWR